MRNNTYLGIAMSAFVFVLMISCAKQEDAPQSADQSVSPAVRTEEESARRRTSDIAPGAPAQRGDTRGGQAEDDGRTDGLEGAFLAPMALAKGRMLEYTVRLEYETEDILASRKKLLELVSKYGFVKQSSASTDTRTPYVNAEVMVKSELLYEALRDFELLGLLKDENITVTDHTESMVAHERNVQRENVRVIRRNKAMGQLSAQNRNWQQVEQSIEQSENKLDQAEQGKWHILDLVSWARITVSLKGPDVPNRISVPLYWNALVGLVNLFLRFLYLVIWLFPFIIIGLILWRYRGTVRGVFRKKL